MSVQIQQISHTQIKQRIKKTENLKSKSKHLQTWQESGGFLCLWGQVCARARVSSALLRILYDIGRAIVVCTGRCWHHRPLVGSIVNRNFLCKQKIWMARHRGHQTSPRVRSGEGHAVQHKTTPPENLYISGLYLHSPHPYFKFFWWGK